MPVSSELKDDPSVEASPNTNNSLYSTGELPIQKPKDAAHTSTTSDGLVDPFQTPVSNRRRRVIIDSDEDDSDEDPTHSIPGAYPPSNPNTPGEHIVTPSPVQKFSPDFDSSHPQPLAQRARRFVICPAQYVASPSPGGFSTYSSSGNIGKGGLNWDSDE